MRLWHIDLIPYLPKSQILAQWQELNSIYKKQDKHILINYIYNYGKEYLYCYSKAVIDEMEKRNYKIKSFDNFEKYFSGVDKNCRGLKYPEHNEDYLMICYFNLGEKYLRGQKDFSDDIWKSIVWYMISIFYKIELRKT